MDENNKLNNKNKIIKVILGIVALILIVILCAYMYLKTIGNNSKYTEIKTEGTNIEVEYSNAELTGEYKNYLAKINLDGSKINIEGTGVTNNNSTITINKAGTYYLTGSSEDLCIVIDAGKEDEVQLVLDNSHIKSKTASAINGIKAKKLTITLKEGSENVIEDAENYTVFTDAEKEEPDGAIFTKTDLVINGSGKLVVKANYSDGIVSKDGLKIINSNIEINSKDDGIRGKDYVAIKNSNIKITAKGDGIKSTNDASINNASGTDTVGYVVIEGGTFEINSECDGIQAKSILNISKDASINITTNGTVTKSNSNQNFGKMGRGGFSFGNNQIADSQSLNSSEDSSSSKGLKAGEEITIEGGNIKISSTDDSVHSNGIIVINGGNFNLSSGDDGIHADTSICINNGNIDITKSYEGIESSYIEINGGEISVVSSDDGINVAGGTDSSSMGDRMGQNSFSNVESQNRKLVINGGNVKVNSTGDGLDSNGSIYINGGNVYVIGPTESGNGPLDYDQECVVKGGNIIIYGSTGMWQNPSNSSTQNSLTYKYSGKSGDEIVLKDSNGTEIASLKAEKSYGGITFSNSKIEQGKSYTLYVNGNVISTIECNTSVSTDGLSGNSMMPGKDRMNLDKGNFNSDENMMQKKQNKMVRNNSYNSNSRLKIKNN